MARAPRIPDELRGRVFRGSVALRRGWLTPDELRGPTWRALFHDVYVEASLPVNHALRAHAAAAVLRPGGVVTGRSAAVLWGVDLAAATDDVEITLPPGAHPVRLPGLRVRRALLDDGDVCLRRGVRVTVPEATAVALARSLPLDDAVIAVDQLTSGGLASLPLVRELAGRATGAGSRRARQACALADGLAESPQETRLRLVIVRGGLPAPVAQLRVVHEGRFVARVDFGWPVQRVAVEYDGLWHAEPGQFARDRARLNRLQAAGWRVVFVTAADLKDPPRLIATIAAALTGVVR
ncbi:MULTISPECIES: endonuclease domain-containing protein [unclassified Modestobacter]|uniref:endonuclease domain-containing protein n=1 Tax=unclassified Modestobacter TaxID=2643866 RepID=UPI0022AB0A38|nr:MULTISPECIES: hypothetical protein [unclassified Modestobacter]MCZ2825194.1 hypothetical protein [Modestobacter sp. VKM Ac-2981]MCZ2853741.1 hypothetical protein [Modestobacter sp. VKM Ac-2982]